jgi:hypothetical protein
MNVPIVLFLVAGAVFGLATYSRRHLFSEGPSRRDDDESGPGTWIVWVLTCTALWPLMIVSALYALWYKRGPGRR